MSSWHAMRNWLPLERVERERDLLGVVPQGAAPAVKGRGPKGGKHYTPPKGYAMPPGTGPAGKTCRDCAHYVSVCGGAKNYPKCKLCEPNWTHGRGSDILARSPACAKFTAK